MKIVRLQNPNAPVTVKVTIDGIDFWKYSYKGDQTFNNSIKDPIAMPHALGLSKDLDKDYDYWTIYLGNVHDTEVEVTVFIEWFENNKQIAKWVPTGADENGKLTIKGDNGKKITDSCHFIVS